MASKKLSELRDFKGKQLLLKLIDDGSKIDTSFGAVERIILGLLDYILSLEERIEKLEKDYGD